MNQVVGQHRTAVPLLVGLALALGAGGGSIAVAQPNTIATQPAVVAPPPVSSAYAGAEIRRTGANKDAPVNKPIEEGGESSPAAEPAQGLDTARIVVSLVVVLGLIFGLKLFGQKWFNPIAARSSNRTVETLSRAIIGPKQHVLLIRVGKRRVLVVGDSGGKLSALDQITDADEIAELVGQVHSDKLGPAAHAFAGLFGKSAERFKSAEPESDMDEMDETEPVIDRATVDSSVSSTQRDLQSLLSKVRRVSGKLNT